MFLDFIHLLHEREIPINLGYTIEFYRGLRQGLVQNLEELFLFARLCFIKRVEHLDRFERAFIYYFTGKNLPSVAEGDPALLETSEFRQWLRHAVQRGELQPISQNLSPAELMQRFWDTVREQTSEHHGGSKWVGTGGTSPFGHSGFSKDGVRVSGGSRNQSAMKVFGDRRYVDYSDDHKISDNPIGQALGALRNLKPAGAHTELDIQETIYYTGRNGGEIELIFKRPLRDKLKIALFMDNGGASMLPFVNSTQRLFDRVRDRFKDSHTYYFHNTIFEYVYTDAARSRSIPVQKILQNDEHLRIIIVGDASMGPHELTALYGAVDYYDETPRPSLDIIKELQARFKAMVWLNPIAREYWRNGGGAWTLQKIRQNIFMEDLSLRGLKNAIDYLNQIDH